MDNLRELQTQLEKDRDKLFARLQDINNKISELEEKLRPVVVNGDCFKLEYDDSITYIQVIEAPNSALMVDDTPYIGTAIISNADFMGYVPCPKEEFIEFYNKISKELKSKIIK